MSSAEALRDVLRFLNRQEFDGRLDDAPLNIVDDAIVAGYATLNLGSSFHPILTRDGSLVGYQATTTVTSDAMRDFRLFDVWKLAVTENDRREVIYLDRLVRTLHALNFIACGLTSDLHLIVNPQHLQSVHADHGQVFAQILAQCGLQPDCIVIEVGERAVANKQHLRTAIMGWQQRRYRIAIDFDGEYGQLPRVLSFKPDIIKFDGGCIARLAANSVSRKTLESMIAEISDHGIPAIATGIDDIGLYDIAHGYDFFAWQGKYSTVRVDNSLATDAA